MKRQYMHLIIPALIVFIYLLPYVIFGSDVHLTIHDVLDDISWMGPIILGQSPEMINSPFASEMPQIMNGIPRDALISELNFYLWLNVIFPPIVTYFLNQLIIRSIAMVGMYLLLKKYFLNEKDNIISSGVSACFAILPFYPTFQATIAGMPLFVGTSDLHGHISYIVKV